eukprot:m.662239 g.662239  ORF g.662239 m.662239 type:complete len:811 (-) comp58472_c0_seq15:1808-4240(-)
MSMFDALKRKLTPDQQSETATESGLEQQTRAQLLAHIHSLIEKNDRYNMRFRDVVSAYKSVLKEKEALEATLSALSSASVASTPRRQHLDTTLASSQLTIGSTQLTTGSESALDVSAAIEQTEHTVEQPDAQVPTREGSAQLDGTHPVEADGAIAPSQQQQQTEHTEQSGEPVSVSQAVYDELQQKVAILTQSLQTLTEEKSTMLSRFQNDKKAVAEAHRTQTQSLVAEHESKLRERDDAIGKLKAESSHHERTCEHYKQQLNGLHEIQHEKEAAFERERKSHREEVVSLTKQRSESQQLRERLRDVEDKLQRAKDAELDALTQLNSVSTDLRSKVSALEEEILQLRNQLTLAESKGESEEMLRIKQEGRVMRKTIELLRATAAEANRNAHDVTIAAQHRITTAETTVAHLQKLQLESQEREDSERLLRENRLSELSSLVGKYEAEKSTLAQANAALSDKVCDLQDDNEQLHQQLLALQTASKSQHTDTINGLQDKITKLKALLRLANQKGAEPKSATKDLQEQTEDADECVVPVWLTDSYLDIDHHNTHTITRKDVEYYYFKAKEYLLAKQELQRQVSALQTPTKAELPLTTLSTPTQHPTREQPEESTHVNGDCALRERVQALEAQLARQRDRSIRIINDKDAEIAELQARVEASLAAQAVEEKPARADSAANQARGSGDSTAELSLPAPAPHSTLHLVSIERNEETSHLKQRMRDMEAAIIEFQQREVLTVEQLEMLKGEIRRLERNASRGSANLEYLKNVIVKYMENTVNREQMLRAIATILEFSPDEIKRVQRTAGKSTWWPSSS